MKYLGLFLIGLLCGWVIESIRWDAAVSKTTRELAQQREEQATKVSNDLLVSWAATENMRAEFIDYKNGAKREIAKLESSVAAGTVGLRVNATCTPAVQTPGAVPGRTNTGTCELDPAARQGYYALRQGLEDQLALLMFCRAELKKRSQ